MRLAANLLLLTLRHCIADCSPQKKCTKTTCHYIIHSLLQYALMTFPFYLTQDVFIVLWYEGSPVLSVWFLDVYVDETVSRRIQVGAESKHSSLIGNI